MILVFLFTWYFLQKKIWVKNWITHVRWYVRETTDHILKIITTNRKQGLCCYLLSTGEIFFCVSQLTALTFEVRQHGCVYASCVVLILVSAVKNMFFLFIKRFYSKYYIKKWRGGPVLMRQTASASVSVPDILQISKGLLCKVENSQPS